MSVEGAERTKFNMEEDDSEDEDDYGNNIFFNHK